MSTFDLFSTLQCCGEPLALLLAEAKSEHKTPETPIYNRVDTAITGLIKDLEQNKDEGFTTEECFRKVVEKIESTLEELTKYDSQNASNYRDLATRLGKFVSTFSQTLPTSTATHTNNNSSNNNNTSVNNNNNNDNNVQHTNIDLENLYSSLTNRQHVLLELFAVLPQGTEVKENDLRLCWYSITEINVDSERTVKFDFEEQLDKLVEMKIIERVVTGVGSVKKNSKREGVKYTMPNIIWSNCQKYCEPPSLATMAESLKVLNLKGCHNLESLPPQFNKMLKWELGYLDISECYLLDHLPDALSGCIKLRVLKGFVLPKEQTPDQPFISTPSQFQHLWKLTLRTKRLNFPTKSDLAILCELGSLTHLKITWVGACSGDDNNEDVQFEEDSKFPPKLTKFEMEAASDSTSQKILDLIARPKEATANVPDNDTKPPVSLNKLYIKGGNLSKLDQNVDCKILRLQYLPNMQHSCYDMMRTFPTLHRLEMSKDVMYSMLRQSFQKATGTTDQNSGWEPSFSSHHFLD